MPTAEKVETIVTDRPGEVEKPIVVVKVSPMRQILVRVARTWLQAFVALSTLLIGAALVVDLNNWGNWLQPAFLTDIGSRLLVCVIVSTLMALFALAQNAAEFFYRVDNNHPLWRA